MLKDIRCNTTTAVVVASDGTIDDYSPPFHSLAPVVVAIILFFICVLELVAMMYLVYGREDSDEDLKEEQESES